MHLLKNILRLGLCSLVLLSPCQGQSSEPIHLKRGDRLVFLGDSITHAGHYVAPFQQALWCLYPDLDLTFFNAGISGDVAGQALERLDAEVIAQDPAVVTILLGMNDARYRAADADLLNVYRQDMERIVKRLSEETDAQLVLLSPSYYDAASVQAPRKPAPGYNDTLLLYGESCRSLALQYGARFVDLNGPLRHTTESLRTHDPKATIIPDGVHPDEKGGLVMAAAMLEALLPPNQPALTPLPRPTDPGAASTVEILGRPLPGGLGSRWRFHRFDASALPADRYEIQLGDQKPVALEVSARETGSESVLQLEFPTHPDVVQRAEQLGKLIDRYRRFVLTDVRDEVWKVKQGGTVESRRARYASIHGDSLKLTWTKIAALEKQLAPLTSPIPITVSVRRIAR